MSHHWHTFLNNQIALSPETSRLFNLLSYGLLKVSGADAKKLLQGQFTCDVEKIEENVAIMGAHCNPKGRVLSLFYLFLMQENYYLFMLRRMIPIALLALKKYAAFYKVELNDVSEQFCLIAYTGQSKLAHPHPSIITLPLIKPYQLIINEATNTEKIQSLQSIVLDESKWKWQTINDKIPTIYPDTSGVFLPHDIHLNELGAISFNKGCYTGQEIIARMHYLGKIKNHLYRVNITSLSPLIIGSDIYYLQNQEMRPGGTLVDFCHHKQDNYHALIVTDQLNAKTNHLFLNDHPRYFFEFLD